MPAAANSLQLEWPEPWGCGAPVSGYAVEMAPADAVLTVQGPPTPPQVSGLSRKPWHLNGQLHMRSLSHLSSPASIPHHDSVRQLVLNAVIGSAAARSRQREPDDIEPLSQIMLNC